MPILEVKNLTITYKIGFKDFDAVKDVSFGLDSGDTLAIVGESGSGKTTLALSILGLLPRNAKVRSGKILFKGQNVLEFTRDQWNTVRWKKISMIFQASMSALDPVKKVGDQLIELYRYHNRKVGKEEVKRKVEEIVKMVDLSPKVLNLYPHELSGGMKQRVIIASSLLLEPELLIADEPTTALDVITQAEILSLIKKIADEKNIALMFITHDLNLVSQICKRILIMYGGLDVEQGVLMDVISNPLHPYTKHLIDSLFEIEKGQLVQGKRDQMPFISPYGCPFEPRCAFSRRECKLNYPIPIISNSRTVRCVIYEGGEIGRN